ncbi:TPA: amino acid adenylation domain-containing protein [Staphylococcus aureus]
MAKWQADGNIQYLGRIDDQVKIRGYRIELGEIENTLLKIKNVDNVTVVTKQTAGNELILCGYLVSKEELNLEHIKAKLRQELPEYMVPTHMIQIESLPTTSNGKLDKKLLPEIEVKQKIYVGPRNETEEVLAQAYREVLKIDSVGIDDNFFEIGGHSLKAIGVINIIESLTNQRIPLKMIFENPTIRELASMFEETIGMDVINHIPKVNSKKYYLTSSPQKRLYVLNEIDPNQLSYNMAGILEINGEVDVNRVERAFKKIIDRHESLRTYFKSIEGEPVQIIQDNVDFELENINDETSSCQEMINNFVRPFNLEEPPLMRVGIVKRDNNHYYLLVDMHHIISDGMSINMVVKEFSDFYQDRLLEPLNIQYKDYSEWMRNRDLESQKSYWLKQFKDDIPVLDLPCDYSRPTNRSNSGKTLKTVISASLKEKISKFTQQTNSTDYMVLLSAFTILLHKYSRQEDIVIGSPVSGRTHKDTEGIIGMFVNTLALRNYPESTKSFDQVLKETKDLLLKAYDNQDYPFEELVDEVVETRDLTRNPLFDVLFVLQNNESVSIDVPEWKSHLVDINVESSKFDLSMTIEEDKQTYVVSIEYADELFKSSTIEYMLNHYVTLLERLIESPSTIIDSIDMIDEKEKNLVLNKFNDTKKDDLPEETIVELFEKQVEKTPNNIAVVCGGEKLTYKELNNKANQLGHKLRSLGVKPNDLIGLMTDRRVEMIIGIYGILKAGGAYVPIDPNYPEERKKYILKDSKVKILLTDQDMKIETYKEKIINLTKPTVYENRPSYNLTHISHINDLIYVIYTSGTTGKPKGVMVPYKGVMNRLNWMVEEYKLSNKDIILFKTPYTFDVSVWEIFGWAVFGGQVVLLPSGEEGNPDKIIELIEKHKITMVHFVPSMLKAFLTNVRYKQKISNIGTLNNVLSSGELLINKITEEFKRLIGDKNKTTLINLYGPTETSIEVCDYRCENNTIYRKVPIGKPIYNTSIYILQNETLCGINTPGELCIAGKGVTRGYLNRPDLTKEKFIDNPFGEGKLYRTGDLAKWQADGNIQYLGRIDDQVKIRGYRIELGEIENTLLKIKNVDNVTVVTKQTAGNELILCGYLVSKEELNLEHIKAKLRQELPEYMVPTHMIQIESLPTTSNGKLDKKLLPEIEVKQKIYVGPRNETEEVLAQAYREVLKIDSVGIDDNFFEIGGHSLKAIKLASVLSKKYDVSLKDIFEWNNIRDLSRVLINRKNKNIVEKLESLKKINNNLYINKTEDEIYIKNITERYKNIEFGNTKTGKNVLLTGSTGYFGIHLLRELLLNTDSKIFILMRNNKENSLKKLMDLWLYYFDDYKIEFYKNRLNIVQGDISKQNLDIEKDQYVELANKIDIIINSAANVNHFGIKEVINKVNIDSLEYLLDFSNYKRPKEIHQMSTKSIASGEIQDKKYLKFTEEDIFIGQNTKNVYVESKIKGELLLNAARNENSNINIYRLGNLQCDSKNGIFQLNDEDNAFFKIITSFKDIKAYPTSTVNSIEFTEVDKAATACIKLIFNKQLKNETFHIYNHNYLSLDFLMKYYRINYDIKKMVWTDFLDFVINELQNNNSNSLDSFLLHTGIFDDTFDSKTEIDIDSFKTNYILSKLNFEWEPINDKILEKMFENKKNKF